MNTPKNTLPKSMAPVPVAIPLKTMFFSIVEGLKVEGLKVPDELDGKTGFKLAMKKMSKG
mgnify:CR=1 FL=1